MSFSRKIGCGFSVQIGGENLDQLYKLFNIFFVIVFYNKGFDVSVQCVLCVFFICINIE